MKKIVILGSTGSVGKNVLSVAGDYPDAFRVIGISSYGNVDLLAEQAERFKPRAVGIGDKSAYDGAKKKFKPGVDIFCGAEGLAELAALDDADMVFMAISGIASFGPLVAALKAGKTVALASKEPIVSAGSFIVNIAKKYSARIIPVDSEHSAVMQCLSGRKKEDVGLLYLTASGGSLRERPSAGFKDLTIEEVLAHPKWDMGKKITVDSATMMNKGLEVIEARWLFDIPAEKIKVVIHPEAIIHAMVEFIDGVVAAGMFMPDMRFPILRALSYPGVVASDLARINFSRIGKLSFFEPDLAKFPALGMAYKALADGGTMPAVLNGANEGAVGLFLSGKIPFTGIVEKISSVLSKHKNNNDPALDDIIAAEKWAYEEVRSCLRF